MRYDAEHKARTREKVLDEAVRAIRQEGPGQIGVAGVMQRAGLTHGGFYAHFDSRDELVLAAVQRMFADAQDTFRRVIEGLPPREALRTYVRFYLSRAHRDARDTGCPLPLLSSDLPRMGEPARQRFEEGVARLTGLLRDLLDETGRPDAGSLAGSALSEMIGALSLSRAVSDRAQSDAILLRSREAVLERFGLKEEDA
ncbi:TetR/AcrR family transcriptional regulator [Caulobacter sp. S45]|uniref:TetR/AcrR family transcriptional regulator n=1 Tax=Caulobacter sp. S45 TaxID=1641861 RepID=UPI001575A80B|nr:TetR/AcrR family transcriptional regulator [Caulobacter sp. S45]